MTNTFKIGVTGTHSTGKSSFIGIISNCLKERNVNFKTVSDLAAKAKTKGFPILQNHTEESTLWLVTYGMSLELELSLKNDVLIVDRPIIDAIGYFRAAMQITNRSINDKYLHMLLTIASEWICKYAILYKTVLDTSIALGPGRDGDLEFRILADCKIDETINDLGLKPTLITEQSHKEHACHVVKMFTEPLKLGD